MNLFYAAIVACWPGAECVSITDDLSPYATREACFERLEVMKATAIIAFGHLPGVMMFEACGDLDTIRKVIPDAYEGEATA